MPSRTKNARYKKLRRYRDKLIFENNKLKAELREIHFRAIAARRAMIDGDTLRASALLSGAFPDSLPKGEQVLNEAVREIELVYELLATERNYTEEIMEAIRKNDLLRARALTELHTDAKYDRDQQLRAWRRECGYHASMDVMTGEWNDEG